MSGARNNNKQKEELSPAHEELMEKVEDIEEMLEKVKSGIRLSNSLTKCKKLYDAPGTFTFSWNLEECTQSLNRIEKHIKQISTPTNADLLYKEGMRYLQDTDLSKSTYQSSQLYFSAGRYFSDAILANPKYVNAYLRRGQLASHAGLFNDAIHDFTTAISIDSKNFEGHQLGGITKLRLKFVDSAISSLKKALKYAPDLNKKSEVYIQLSDAYSELFRQNGCKRSTRKKEYESIICAIKLNLPNRDWLEKKLISSFLCGCPSSLVKNLYIPSMGVTKEEKENLFARIKEYDKSTVLLELALDKTNALGQIFWQPRNGGTPSLTAGTLKDIQAEIDDRKKISGDNNNNNHTQSTSVTNFGVFTTFNGVEMANLQQRIQNKPQ